ncbi:MAG: FAD:protein FMN transferase [Croceitalea sp.]|nr:FAD:protein FMN transferase [Croceitalea sp.]
MKVILHFVIILFTAGAFAQEGMISVNKVLKLMGTRFEITVVAPSETVGNGFIEEGIAEITRIEKLISSWDAGSETTLINANAGVAPVTVSQELFELIERAKKISEITDGAFDITFASMDSIWKFDGSMSYFPTNAAIKSSVSKVGSHNIILDKDKRTVFLKEKGVKIGFGAIGKGFAADKTKQLLISKGVTGGIINASGDLTTWGTKVTGEKWMVGITNPLDKTKVFSWLPVVESSVATSGNYEKYIVFDGIKYTHIIDPRTGYPISGVKSVTVFAKTAELCDALATAVFIMGKESGLFMIDQMKGVEALLVDENDKIYKSSGIQLDITDK